MLLKIAEHLLMQTEKLAVAESCTGGLVSKMITDLAGSSAWFDAGFVTYSNTAKNHMLNVPNHLIKKHGAVSLEVAKSMATGVLENSHAQWSLATTGIAGPGGGSPLKPVGTVCFAWAYAPGQVCKADTQLFQGERDSVRMQAAEYALEQLWVLMERQS